MVSAGDTIAAVASGGVVAAIGIVRVSGPAALEVTDRVFRPRDGRRMSDHGDRQLVYGELLDREGRTLDLCLCTVSRAPGSYTGENTAELQCHGSPVVLRQALESLFAAGARQALAGEFTKRAFLNGRMDLTRAEAVIDVIEARSPLAARNAVGQLAGSVQRAADGIYETLTDICSHYHAVLDYPDEDIPEFTLSQYARELTEAAERLERLLSTFERGRYLDAGVPAVIAGKPNAGKSSLLNALLGYDRAIVTDVPGTTRDTVEEKLPLGGVLLRLTDTAGIRAAADEIEEQGVERSRRAAGQASLALLVLDGSAPLTEEDEEAIAVAQTVPHLLVAVNKCDLPRRLDVGRLADRFSDVVSVSARTGEGLETLRQAIAAQFPEGAAAEGGVLLTNARQADAVSRALGAVQSARSALRIGMTPDVVLTDTEEALRALGELNGRSVRDDLVETIFSRFCVGK